MIKNIVFDIGGVIVDYDPKGYLSKLFNNSELEEFLYNITFDSEDSLFKDSANSANSAANAANAANGNKANNASNNAPAPTPRRSVLSEDNLYFGD